MILPFFAILQVMIGIGASVGISFFITDKTYESTAYIATGVPTITLITIGMTLLPQMIADDKDKGIIDYVWALPISRLCYLMADLTVWIITSLPGVVVSMVVGRYYYHMHYNISLQIILIYLLVSVCSCLFGYTVANLSNNSQITLLICNFLIFSLFLFSPIAYSLNQLPVWLQQIHRCLPIIYMADLMRRVLLGYGELNRNISYLVVIGWTVVCFLMTVKAINKKK